MAEPLPKSPLAVLLSDGKDGQVVLSAASIGMDLPEITPPTLRPRDFADEVTGIFHKAKRAALADSN